MGRRIKVDRQSEVEGRDSGAGVAWGMEGGEAVGSQEMGGVRLSDGERCEEMGRRM